MLIFFVLFYVKTEYLTYQKGIIIGLFIGAYFLAKYIFFFIGKADLNHRVCPYPECKERQYENKITNLIKANQELSIAQKVAAESDRLQSAFLANISHEIRTPLNSIIGFSQILNNEEITYDLRKTYIDIITQNSNYLLQVMDDIISMAKIEAGSIKPIQISGSVSNLFHEIDESIRNDLSIPNDGGVDFKIVNELRSDQDFITTDFVRLKQVLNGLIVNAFKFTKKGFVELGCMCAERGNLLFYVKDSGIGIPKEQHEVVFQRFRQGEDQFLTKEYKGTGLGLTISKGLTELMNGEIWVESDIGVGATFYLTIPYLKSEKPINYD